MTPYIDCKPELCSSCNKPAIAKVVLMPNGFVIRCCNEHLLQVAELLKKGEVEE